MYNSPNNKFSAEFTHFIVFLYGIFYTSFSSIGNVSSIEEKNMSLEKNGSNLCFAIKFLTPVLIHACKISYLFTSSQGDNCDQIARYANHHEYVTDNGGKCQQSA